MICVRDVARIVERAAPLSLALPDDNCGLQVGSPEAPVRKVFVALDPSPAAVARAAAARADLLVTHHPLLYERPRSIDPRSFQGAAIGAAIKAGLAVYAAHTNLDCAPAGLGMLAAQNLGLQEVGFLSPAAGPRQVKIVVFVPVDEAPCVLLAMAAAGAGRIGRYDHCAFFGPGEGLFRPLPGAHPAVGTPGRLERTPETRVEMVAPEAQVPAVVAAMREVHPYEEPAFDVYPLETPPAGGLGCLGSVAPTALPAFARRAAAAFKADARVSGRARGKIRKVAVVPGSGGSLLHEAVRAGADVLVTGEIRYHQMREAEHAGIAVVELGHDRSEMPAVGLLVNLIRAGLAAEGRSVPVGYYQEPPAGRPVATRRQHE